MNDSLRQTGRSHKQIIEALERLSGSSVDSLRYVLPEGQYLPYYLDMTIGIMQNKQIANPYFEFRVARNTMQVSFKMSPEARPKFLIFKYEKAAMAQGLHPDQIVMDHSFTD